MVTVMLLETGVVILALQGSKVKAFEYSLSKTMLYAYVICCQANLLCLSICFNSYNKQMEGHFDKWLAQQGLNLLNTIALLRLKI